MADTPGGGHPSLRSKGRHGSAPTMCGRGGAPKRGRTHGSPKRRRTHGSAPTWAGAGALLWGSAEVHDRGWDVFATPAGLENVELALRLKPHAVQVRLVSHDLVRDIAFRKNARVLVGGDVVRRESRKLAGGRVPRAYAPATLRSASVPITWWLMTAFS